MRLKRAVESAHAKWERADRRLGEWAAANGHLHLTNGELIKIAPANLSQSYNTAHEAWRAAEHAAVDAGRAYFGSYGTLNWHR